MSSNSKTRTGCLYLHFLHGNISKDREIKKKKKNRTLYTHAINIQLLNYIRFHARSIIYSYQNHN